MFAERASPDHFFKKRVATDSNADEIHDVERSMMAKPTRTNTSLMRISSSTN